MSASIESTALIVNAARGWLGTPFHHQARQKGIGCDCLGLIIGIAEELQLPSRTGKPLYFYDRQDYHYRRDAALLLPQLQQYMWPSKQLALGNIVVLQLCRMPQHIGILAINENEFNFIHACMRHKKVIEQPLRPSLQKLVCAIFAFCPTEVDINENVQHKIGGV